MLDPQFHFEGAVEMSQPEHNFSQSTINDPMSQSFVDLKLASTLSKPRSQFGKRLANLKKEYEVRTSYIRVHPPDNEKVHRMRNETGQQIQQMHSLTDIGVPPKMAALFKQLGYNKIEDEMRYAISSLLLQRVSYQHYHDAFLRDALLALVALTATNKQTLQSLLLCPDEEAAVQLHVVANHLNQAKGVYLYFLSERNPIKEDKKHLQFAQLVIGTPERVLYTIKQGYLKMFMLESLVITEINLLLDLGFGDELKQILSLTPQKCCRHAFYSKEFTFDID